MGIKSNFKKKKLHNDDQADTAAAIDQAISRWSISNNCDEMKEELSEIKKSVPNSAKYAFKPDTMKHQGKLAVALVLLLLAAGIILAIAFFVSLYSVPYRVYGITGIVGAAVIVLVNLLLIIKLAIDQKKSKQYQELYKALSWRNEMLVSELSAITSIREKTVVAVLRWAIRKKWIPQGHLACTSAILFVSDEAYRHYQNNQEENDAAIQNAISQAQQRDLNSPGKKKLIDQCNNFDTIVAKCASIPGSGTVSASEVFCDIVATMRTEANISSCAAKELRILLAQYQPLVCKIIEYSSETPGAFWGEALFLLSEIMEKELQLVLSNMSILLVTGKTAETSI